MVRAADVADIAALHEIVERAYRGESARRGWTHEADLLGGQRTDQEELAELLADPNAAVLLQLDGEALIGCVKVLFVPPKGAHLGMLAIDPDRQAKGLGAGLIAAAETFARDRFGADHMEMTVIAQRSELIAYYLRRGFYDTGERRAFPYGNTRFGLPQRQDLSFVVLQKRLA
jgi:ribosomal protein S18 acetylase RimI-like enzyme